MTSRGPVPMHLVYVIAIIFGLLTTSLLMVLFSPPPRVLMHRFLGALVRVPKPILLGGALGLILLIILPRLYFFFVFVAFLIALLLRPPQVLTRWFTNAPLTPALSRFWLGVILGLFLTTSIIPLTETSLLAGIVGWDVAEALNPYHLSRITQGIDWYAAQLIAAYPHDAVLLVGIAGWGVVLTLISLPRWRAALPFVAALALITTGTISMAALSLWTIVPAFPRVFRSTISSRLTSSSRLMAPAIS